MKKLLLTVLILSQLLLDGVFLSRQARYDRDIDHLYDFTNTSVVNKINEDRDAIMYLRQEIADIMVELTRKGLLDEAPPEAPIKPAPHV